MLRFFSNFKSQILKFYSQFWSFILNFEVLFPIFLIFVSLLMLLLQEKQHKKSLTVFPRGHVLLKCSLCDVCVQKWEREIKLQKEKLMNNEDTQTEL